MPLSVYVHIPYCLQRCRYCDFATFEWSEIQPPEQYVGWVVQEIRNRRSLWPHNEMATLYFGGGTPSLIAPELIVTIVEELAKSGLPLAKDAEVTIEINPATLTQEKLDAYLRAGINRFSVGAQTFNDGLLKMCGRKHSAADTRSTLRMLEGFNYSFDLLFALPGQTLVDLSRDLEEVLAFAPPHLSAYCLTVPEGHPMAKGRAPEDEQVEMFALIEGELDKIGLRKYEISNFAQAGRESRHNMAYWTDVSYWGIGLSSHSYMRESGPWGMRFWNPKSMKEYEAQSGRVGAKGYSALLPASQFEVLAEHEALTDFCHMHLRTTQGMPKHKLASRFQSRHEEVLDRANKLMGEGLLLADDHYLRMSPQGQLLSNRVFLDLAF